MWRSLTNRLRSGRPLSNNNRTEALTLDVGTRDSRAEIPASRASWPSDLEQDLSRLSAPGRDKPLNHQTQDRTWRHAAHRSCIAVVTLFQQTPHRLVLGVGVGAQGGPCLKCFPGFLVRCCLSLNDDEREMCGIQDGTCQVFILREPSQRPEAKEQPVLGGREPRAGAETSLPR